MSRQEKHLPKIDKNPMQQITNHSKNKLNKLASRLYRNSSLSHINSNISMLSAPKNQLDPSFLNFSSNMSSNQLVASISLKKMKKKIDNQPYMQISNGKLLVNRNKSEFDESSFQESMSNNKKMFKKLQKLSYSPTNRILPDELIDFTIEKEHNEAKPFKKSSLSPKAKNKKLVNDKEDLLPEDFIQLLEEQKKITNQFCYLKKMQHPYDLKIVEFEKNLEKKSEDSPVQYPSQYITISSRGITYFSQDQSRFVTLEQWKKEANYFKKIIKLDFFKNFKVIKNFSNWKKYLRKSAMKSTIQKLKQKLFYNDKYLRSSLLKIRDICYIMETDVSYCRLDDCQKVANFRQFKTEQEAFIQNQFERRIFQLEENVKEVLMNNMAESMKEFKEQNKISSSIQGKGMPLLIGDEKNLQMPYTKQATLRTQQQKFQKFIKLIDILITHSKVNMMSESTSLLIRKIDEENDNYQKQTYFESKQKGRQKESMETELMDKSNFKGKQYLECVLTLDLIESGLLLRPTKEDLISLFEDIVNRSVVRLCRNHKKISSDIDVLSIIYDSPEQFPKQSESENLKAIMTSDGRQQQMLRSIMKSILISYEYIARYVERFQKIAIENHKNVKKIEEIEEEKSNGSLKNVEDKLNQQSSGYEKIIILIEQLQKHKEQISKIKKEHDGPIFQVNLKQFKQKTQKRTNLCISKAKQIVPKMFENSMNKLNDSLMKALQNLEEQPTGVESMINFNNHKNQISENVPIYEDQMRQITCLQILMRNILCSSSQVNSLKKYDGQTKKLQSALNSVRNKITDSEKNNKIYQSRAQKQVKEMVPKNRSKISQLYNKIQLRCRQEKTAEQMMTFIHKKNAELKLIFKEFTDIITYQKYLNLEESDPNQIHSFETFFGVFQKIWSTTYEYEKYSAELEQKTCGLIKASEVYSKLQQFINVMVGLQKQVNSNRQKDLQYQFSNHDYSAVNNVLERVQTLKPIIETIECLNDPVLGDKQWKEIKSILQQKNVPLFRVLQIDKNERKTKEYIKTNASSQLKLFQSIVIKAKKSQQISQKFQSIKNFTNFSKQHLGLFRNLTEKFKTYIGQILEEIDNKIMMVNYILEETESNENERAKSEKNTLEKLKEILLLWDQYEQHVQYFQPIYNLTDWKSTPEAKLFISATDQNWKKIYKSNKDSNLSKILMNERIIPSLKESNEMLQSIYPSLNEYFNSKRLQCMRLYFLSNDEIVNIHSQNKDFKSLNLNINKIFPTIKQLLFRGEELNPCEIINMDGQVLQLKAGRVANYDVEQMVKFIDDGIKIGVKSTLKACNTAYENQKFDKLTWIKQYPLQTLIFISNVYFSTIIQQDYLTTTTQQIQKDLEKYEHYHLSQIEGYREMISEASSPLLKKKLYVLLTQALNIRDIISSLIHENVKTKEEYEWLKHIRCSYRQDQAFIEYFNYHVSYGNEFVCMIENPLIQIFSNQKTLLKLVNCMMDCNSIPLVTSSLLPQLSTFNAKSYHRLSLSTGNEINILKSYIQGTWLTGSFTDICLPVNVSDEQLIIIAKTVQQIQTNLKETNFLRGFKNMPLNRQAGISLISSTLTSFPSLKQCNFDNRVLATHEIPWGIYMELLFNIYGINVPNFSKKIQFTFTYLQKTIQNFKISRQSVKDWVIEASFMTPNNQTEIARLFLNYIKKKDFKNHERKYIFKMFMEVFNITHINQIQSHKSIRESSSCEQEISKLISILKQNKVCILIGKNSEFQDYITHEIQRQFCEQNAKFNYFIVNQQNLNYLLGQYINGKWVYGLLAAKIRECKNSDCIVLVGKISQTLIQILQILNSDDQNKNFLNLENGQKIFLNKNQKIILMSEDQMGINKLKNCNLKVFDLGGVKYSPEEVLAYITQQKKRPLNELTIQNKHFKSNPESLSSLLNLYVNNLQKINNSNLKMIGYKSEYIQSCLIMNRFSVLISATLANDKQKCCIQNLKMMEKLYVWCLYWSIGSCLPKTNMGRLDKLFDSIKIEYDKSESLRQSKFSISQRNMTISKFIKDEKIFSNRLKDYFIVSPELQAKANLIKLLKTQNNHIMLIGERNSGKSSYMEYLENVLENEGCSIFKAKITKQTTLNEFLTWIKPKIYTQYFPNKTDKKYKLCPVSGKKLIIFVDNFNFINRKSSLMQFFHSTSTFGYYYDFNNNRQIYLGDICFICAKNGNFQAVNNEYTFLLRNFFPICVNSPQLSQIMEVYSQDLQNLEQDKKELFKKILSSISSLHLFIVNLLHSQKCKRIINITFNPPIWIAKELIKRCKDENCSHNDVISLWKYLSVKKYIESGLLSEFADEITHQISNLISLIVKSSTESQFFLRNQTKFIRILEENNPLLSINYNYSEYYIFLSYLIGSSQPKHLISHSCLTPKMLKKNIISEICAQYHINFSYLDQIESLPLIRNKRNMMIYVDGSNEMLVEKVLAVITEQNLNPHMNFIIDAQNKQQLMNYTRFYPTIEYLTHIYDVQSKLCEKIEKIDNYETISSLLIKSGIQKKSHQYQEMFWQFSKMNGRLAPKLKQIIIRRLVKLKSVLDNLSMIEQTIEQSKTELTSLTEQIEVLSQKQGVLLSEKNKKVESLSKLKNKQNLSDSSLFEKETLNKGIYALDAEIKKIKSEKNEKTESISKIKQSSKQRIQVFALLQSQKKVFANHYEICQMLTQNQQFSSIMTILHSAVFYYFENSQLSNSFEFYASALQLSRQKLRNQLPHIYAVILGAAINNISEDECVIRWIFSSYQCFFVTNKVQLVIEKLQNASAEVKLCLNQYQFNQNVGVRPIISKQASQWGESKVTVVTSEQSTQKNSIEITFGEKECNKQFIKKIEEKLMYKNNENYLAQLSFSTNEKKRLQNEDGMLEIRLLDKLKIDKSIFAANNSISQVRQIMEAKVALSHRISANEQKIKTIANEIQSKYQKITSKCLHILQYIKAVKQLYPYFNNRDNHLVSVIEASFVFQQEQVIKEDKGQNKEDEQVVKEYIKKFRVEQTQYRIELNVFKWIYVNLSPSDSVVAYFLQACFKLKQQKSLTQKELEYVLATFKRATQENSLNIISKSNESLKQVMDGIMNWDNKFYLMLQFAQKQLHFGFKNAISLRQEWITTISRFVQSNSHPKQNARKFYLLVAPLQENCCRMIQKQIRRHISSQQSILYLSDKQSVEHRIQGLQKLSLSQQGWIILRNWKNKDKIKKIKAYIEESKIYKAVFVVQNTVELEKLKAELNPIDYFQLYLSNKNNRIFSKLSKIIKKHYIENCPQQLVQANRLLKVIAQDQVSQFIKNLTEGKYDFSPLSYNLIEQILKKIPFPSTKDLLQFVLDNYQSSADARYKSIFKQIKNSQSNYENLLESLKNKTLTEDTLKQVLKHFIPENIVNKVSTDSILGYNQNDKAPKITIDSNATFERKRAITKAELILQKAPILCKQQQTEKVNSFHMQMMKREKRELQKIYAGKLEKVKRLNKILESQRYLSIDTEKELIVLTEEADIILKDLLQIYAKIVLLQKNIQSKQKIIFNESIQLLSQPVPFLYSYLFETINLGRVNWGNSSLQIRCITEKEKENLKQQIQKNEYIQVPGLKINNGKFDSHKGYIQSYSSGQSSKLTNVYIYFGKEQPAQLSKSVPFFINDINVAEISVMTKAKEPGIWSAEVTVTLKSEAQKENMKKK